MGRYIPGFPVPVGVGKVGVKELLTIERHILPTPQRLVKRLAKGNARIMLGDLPFFSALRTQMQWHASRQSVLAENIANADTPGYQARDLKRVDHESAFTIARPSASAPTRTDAKHIAGRAIAENAGSFERNSTPTFEVTPEGNSVVLEEEVMKMTANQLDYQTVSTLYQKSLGMLRTAVGRR